MAGGCGAAIRRMQACLYRIRGPGSQAIHCDSVTAVGLLARDEVRMRGVVGEFRLDGGQAGLGRVPRAEEDFGWRSPEGALAVRSWGVPLPGEALGWQLDPESGVLLVADAALYDSDLLRRTLDLPAGVASTPLALLLEAWRRWGEEVPEHLDGDYAFVICDLRRRQVLAATDPVGMRSFFYRFDPAGGIVFGSTPEAVAEWCGLEARIPESRLLEPLFGAEQLAYREPDIEGVDRLLAAHLLTVESTRLRLRRWWRPGRHNPGLAADDLEGWTEGVRWHLDNAVRKRLADGVQAGVQFSGGLDSAAVLALANRHAPGRTWAFSLLNHGDACCPETRAIESTLAFTGVPAQRLIDLADPQAFPAHALAVAAQLPRFIHGRNGFLAVFEQQAAAAGVQVMMNGLDGDLLFFYEDLLERQLRAGRGEALRNARLQDAMSGDPWMEAEVHRLRLSSRLPWWLRARIRDLRARLGVGSRLRESFFNQSTIERFGLKVRMRDYFASLRSPRPPVSGLPTESFIGLVPQEGIARFQQRMRSSGIEMRCPLLDRALIEFVAWLPLEFRLREGHLKWMMRRAVEPLLPPAVVWRGDKLHLGSHFDRAMLQPVLEGLIRDFRGSGPAIAPWVDREAVLRAAERWQASDISAVWQLRTLLLLEHWLQHNAGKVALGR